MKSVFWAPELGHPNRYTSLPNNLDMSLKIFGLVGKLAFIILLAVYIQNLCARCKIVVAKRNIFMSLFYNIHIYQDIFFDLVNRNSYLNEVKQLLLKNTTFTNSNVEHNHQGRHLRVKLGLY